jgi:hypothetical protein
MSQVTCTNARFRRTKYLMCGGTRAVGFITLLMPRIVLRAELSSVKPGDEALSRVVICVPAQPSINRQVSAFKVRYVPITISERCTPQEHVADVPVLCCQRAAADSLSVKLNAPILHKKQQTVTWTGYNDAGSTVIVVGATSGCKMLFQCLHLKTRQQRTERVPCRALQGYCSMCSCSFS